MKKFYNILLIALMGITIYLSITIAKQKQIINEYKALPADTIVQHDTLYQEKILNDSIPIIIEKTIVKTDTFKIIQKDTIQTLLVNLNKTEYQDTVTDNEQDTIIYHAFLTGRGYQNENYPILDSIKFKLKNKYIIEQQTIYKQLPKKIKPVIIPTITTGYDPINKNFGIIIGIGISIMKK